MHFLVYSQLWMSLTGLLLIIGVANVHRITMQPESCIIIFCGLMWVYLLDATASHSPEDKINQSERLKFFEKHARLLGGVRLICLAAAMYFAFQMGLPKESWFFFAGAAVCSWAYSVGFRGRRLKNLSLNKTWLVALVWTAGVFGSIWALEGFNFHLISYGLLAVILALLFLDTALLDWRDQRGDSAHSIRSIFSEEGMHWRAHISIAVALMLAGVVEMIWLTDWLALKLSGLFIVLFLLGMRNALRTVSSPAKFCAWVSYWRIAVLLMSLYELVGL